VIDDDERLHERVRDFLGLKGYECRELTSGEGVLTELESAKPDIVLLDVMMPGEDGFAVLMKIRDVSTVTRTSLSR